MNRTVLIEASEAYRNVTGIGRFSRGVIAHLDWPSLAFSPPDWSARAHKPGTRTLLKRAQHFAQHLSVTQIEAARAIRREQAALVDDALTVGKRRVGRIESRRIQERERAGGNGAGPQKAAAAASGASEKQSAKKPATKQTGGKQGAQKTGTAKQGTAKQGGGKTGAKQSARSSKKPE